MTFPVPGNSSDASTRVTAPAAEPAVPDRNGRLVRGGLLIAVASIAARGASFFAQLILGRVLLPEDFGVYAIALTFTTIAASANSVLRSFLVDALKRDWDVANLYRVVLWSSVVIAVVAAAASPWLARPFHEEGLRDVLFWLFLAMPLQIAPAFGAARLTNNLQFKELSFMWTWSAVVRQIVTVAGAVAGAGPISFVLGVYAGSLVELVMVRRGSGAYPSLRGRPKLTNGQLRRELRWVPASILVLALWINGDYAAAGLFETAAIVGIYFFAYQLTTALTQPFTLAVSSVLLPSFAPSEAGKSAAGPHTTDHQSRDRDTFLFTVLLVPLLSGLPFGLLAVLAAPLTHGVWGGEWDVAIEAVIVLAMVTPMKLLLSTSLSILQARGDWSGYTRLLALSAAATVVAASVGAMIGGVRGLVVIIAIAGVLLGLLGTATVGRSFGLSTAETLFQPLVAWLVWVFAVLITALATPLMQVGLLSMPLRVLVFLLAGVPITYTMFGDRVGTIWRLGTGRGRDHEAPSASSASPGSVQNRHGEQTPLPVPSSLRGQ